MSKPKGNFRKSANGQLEELPKGIIEYKSINTTSEIKDVDLTKKTVTGYASKFGNKDLDDDIIMPGAFKKSVAENGPQGTNSILFLWQHNPSQVLAKPTVLKEDAVGLYYEATVDSGATFAEDALKLIANGLVQENSIGFTTVKSAIIQPDATDWETWYRELYELNLFEHSAVTWGANPEARMTGMKSMNKEELQNLEKKLLKSLREPGMHDETYKSLEFAIKQLNTEYYNLGRKSVSLIEQKAGMLTCPSCKSMFPDPDGDGDNDSNVLTDTDNDAKSVECPKCNTMFQKSTSLIISRKNKSLWDGIAAIKLEPETKSQFNFNFKN